METCLASSCATAIGNPQANIFAYLIQTLLSLQCKLNDANIYPPDRSEDILSDPSKEFDFVIVGSGSAGSVVARRLAEIENWKVLLIEAGENPSFLNEVPAAFPTQIASSDIYAHFVEPEKLACHGSKNKLCKWPSGKAIGGSSTINAMLYLYGNENDYNEWSRMGNEGWSWEEVLPYFKKSNNCDHKDKSRNKYCGRDGPLNVRHLNYSGEHSFDVFLDAARELGVPILDIINSDKFIGYGKTYKTIDSGRRMNVAKAYLSPIKNQKNLYVMKSTRADAVLFDGSRAVGVRVTLKDGRTIDVKASKEVILSAGSVGTSKLLLLSGVGPEQHLRKIGIPSVIDLPVGKNLQDHVCSLSMYMGFRNKSEIPLSPTYLLDQAYQYLVYNQGLLATTNGVDFHGFINVHDSTSKYPNIQFHHAHMPRWQGLLIQNFMNIFNIRDEIIQEVVKMSTEMDVFIIVPTLLKPKSRGEIQLRSKDPADPIKIYANYYSEQEDLDTILKSIDFIKKMLNTKTMKEYGISLQYLDLPDCRYAQLDSEEYWRCIVRHMSSTIFHPVGTAKMGPRSDPTAVVDSQLRVHGLQGLRVIDASIMPIIISGNTNAPTIMIGEKGADFIKKDWMVNKDEL